MSKPKFEMKKCTELSLCTADGQVLSEHYNIEVEKNASEIENSVQREADLSKALPKIPDDQILKIIENQEALYHRQSENFALVRQSLLASEKKLSLVKKALQKAKDHKLNTPIIKLIKFEKKQAKKEIKQFKRLVKKESQILKNTQMIINLLETIN
jgi:hypothetical protein